MARKLGNRLRHGDSMGFTFNTAVGEDFPIKLYMLKYATRLIGNVQLTNDFLEWLLMLMSAGNRKDAINYLYGQIKENNEKKVFGRGNGYKHKKGNYSAFFIKK